MNKRESIISEEAAKATEKLIRLKINFVAVDFDLTVSHWCKTPLSPLVRVCHSPNFCFRT